MPRAGGRKALAIALDALVAALLLASCTSEEERARRSAPAPRPPAEVVVVGSFNFPESELLAAMYAEALEAAGVPVDRQFALGPRELVQPALQQGLVDLVPEYLGSAVVSFGGRVPGGAPELEVRGTLDGLLKPWNLTALDPAPAQNQNGVAVTAATANRLGLATLTDLAGVRERFTIAGPPECRQREHCLPGLRDTYGLEFAEFVPFATATQRATALLERVVDVAIVFTTDFYAASPDIVLLEDDRHLQPIENVVPVASKRVIDLYGDRITRALGRISAALTSDSLTVLNWRVASEGQSTADEAHGWLVRRGIVPR